MNGEEMFPQLLDTIQESTMIQDPHVQINGNNTSPLLPDLFLTAKPFHEQDSGVFSEEVINIIGIVNLFTIATGLALFGIVTNVLNIIVFKIQGFQETVDITLFALSISDIFACVTLVMTAVFHNPLMVNFLMPVISYEVDFMAAGVIHQTAMNATAWLTATVTFERCLCIVIPLKVKTIVTKSRTKALAALIFFLSVAMKVPTFYTTRLGWRHDPRMNMTMFGLIYVEGSEVIDSVTYFVGEFFSAFMSFAIVFFCTLLLIIKLGQKRKWRQSVQKEDTTSSKEKRLVKMVVMVAAIYITCYMPTIFISIWMVMEPEFRPGGKFHNNFIAAIYSASVFESLNACVNFFIYYRMSSKFRRTFRERVCLKKGEGKAKS